MGAEFNRNAPGSDRSFGILFAILLAVAAVVIALKGSQPAAIALTAAAVGLAIIAAVAPRMLSSPNRLWFRFGMLLHSVVSPIVLGGIYFLVITPVALVTRAAGRDELERRSNPARDTYWKDRDPPGPPPSSFDNQF